MLINIILFMVYALCCIKFRLSFCYLMFCIGNICKCIGLGYWDVWDSWDD